MNYIRYAMISGEYIYDYIQYYTLYKFTPNIVLTKGKICVQPHTRGSK